MLSTVNGALVRAVLYSVWYGISPIPHDGVGADAISTTGMTHDHRPNLAGCVCVSWETTLTMLLESVGASHVHFV